MLRRTLAAIVGIFGLGLSACGHTPAAAPAAPAAEGKTKIAFVLLAKPQMPDGGALERAFSRYAGKACQLRVSPDATKTKAEAVVFDFTPSGKHRWPRSVRDGGE